MAQKMKKITTVAATFGELSVCWAKKKGNKMKKKQTIKQLENT